MNKLEHGQYTYKIEIPVTINYSKKEDGSISVDMVSIPNEENICKLVKNHAKEIKSGAEVRM